MEKEIIKKELLTLYRRTLDDNADIYMVIIKLCNLLLTKEVLTFKEVNDIIQLDDKKRKEDLENVLQDE